VPSKNGIDCVGSQSPSDPPSCRPPGNESRIIGGRCRLDVGHRQIGIVVEAETGGSSFYFCDRRGTDPDLRYTLGRNVVEDVPPVTTGWDGAGDPQIQIAQGGTCVVRDYRRRPLRQRAGTSTASRSAASTLGNWSMIAAMASLPTP
jgi:hypothetical protein